MNNVLPKTARQLLHCGSRSASHKHDKMQGDVRRENVYIAVEAESRASPHREFGGLESFEVIRDNDGTWRRCKTVDEFGEYLIRESAARAPYREWATRRNRRELMSRRDKHPVAINTVSFHPASSDLLAARIARGDDGPKLVNGIVARFAKKALLIYEKKRVLLGIAFHGDVDDAHVDCPVARNNGKTRYKGGLGLVGPWTVGVHRQIQSGAKINDEKRRMFTANIEKFRKRYGPGVVALDIQLADAIDLAASEVLGPELELYKKAWAEKVPVAEKAHVIAALTELRRGREKLLLQLDSKERAKYLRSETTQDGKFRPATPPRSPQLPKVAVRPSAGFAVPYQPIVEGPD